MTSKSKNTSKPIEAVKRPAFRFSNSPPPATSLLDWKAHYASKHGEVVEPLITDHKSRTPQPQPIMSMTTTISSGVQEVPVDTTPAPDYAHDNSRAESVGAQSVVSGTDYDPTQEPQPPRDPTPPRDDRISDRTPRQSPRPSPRPPVEGGGGGGDNPNPDHSDDSSDWDRKHHRQRKHYYYSESSDSDSDEDNVRKGIKPRDPDTYDGTNPEKLQNFLFLCSLVFKSKAKTYKSNKSKIYFALSFLRGAALEYFEPVVEFVEELKANFGTASPEEDMETALEELKMEKHHQATWFFISFAQYKAKTTYNDHGYYHLVMNAMPNWILEELRRVFPMPKSYETLHSMILQIDQRYWNHKKIMDLCRKGAPNMAPSGNNNNNNNNQSGNNKSKDNKLNSTRSHLGADGQLTETEKKHQNDNALCLVCGIKGHVAQDCRKARWNQNMSSSSTSRPAPVPWASITEEKPKTDDKGKAKESSGSKNQ
ncbi:hypothetical protein M422DRAFT_249567 [Sphaerobolus stellatus SS14]|uniref:CCHC-type domain-containing protein n=1 Tax=Sphaerobolus stellatus (strain SS14) TaxID=990650 RepID=A0A0C9UUS4_SPHS4|nr:hypothetical protein M422DRAFT_249567 [Sphaerobolus stellatus SS14]